MRVTALRMCLETAELGSLFLSKLLYPLIILYILFLQFHFCISTISLAMVMYVNLSLFFELFNSNCA